MSKMRRYNHIEQLIKEHKPKSIVEVGTWSGLRAITMLKVARGVSPNQPIHYTGYDLWETMTIAEKKAERNGKDILNIGRARSKINAFTSSFPLLSFNLVQGNTKETLKYPVVADFVYIDGGHSINTIRSDYEAVKDSKVILFDDYYDLDENGDCIHDTNLYGCNAVVKDIPNHVIMPIADRIKAGGFIKQVVVIK